MAYTSFGVNDASAVKTWAKLLAIAERDSLDIAPLMGEDEDSIIHIKTETKKGPGDKVTFDLRARLTQGGITEGEDAEGNGEALSIYSDSLFINELGPVVAAKSKNTIDQQRISFDLREQCKSAAAQWWRDRKAAVFFNHVCGYLPANTETPNVSGTKYTGHNTVTAAVGTTRQIWQGGVSNDQSLTSSDGFVLGLIDRAVEAARTGSNMVRSIMVGGQPKYVMYLAEPQVTALRTSTSTGSWQDITKHTYSGVDTSKNPLYTGSLGEYGGVILRRSQDVTLGVNSSSGASVANVRRAVLLGCQGAVTAFGMNNGPTKYRWNEEVLDHKRKLEVSAWLIWGLKKTVFNSTDYGTVVVSTYATS